MVGGFDWDLIYKWKEIPKWEKERLKNPCEPTRTPTMLGAFFCIWKDYFELLGMYDEQFEIVSKIILYSDLWITIPAFLVGRRKFRVRNILFINLTKKLCETIHRLSFKVWMCSGIMFQIPCRWIIRIRNSLRVVWKISAVTEFSACFWFIQLWSFL